MELTEKRLAAPSAAVARTANPTQRQTVAWESRSA